jgi:DNA polymerase/3'-5' exonuclease PolX
LTYDFASERFGFDEEEMTGGLSREQIADRLDEAAELLEAQGANRFRVRAYRMAAETVRSLAEDPADILKRESLSGLTRLPNIGDRLARAIDEMSNTGRWLQLQRMRGEAEPEELFQSIPGIGPQTARAIHQT